MTGPPPLWCYQASVLAARELRDPGGREARDNLAQVLPVGAQVLIRSVKPGPLMPDKYGRYLAAVFLLDGTDVVQALIDNQWAVPWDGAGVQPRPPWPRTVPPPT